MECNSALFYTSCSGGSGHCGRVCGHCTDDPPGTPGGRGQGDQLIIWLSLPDFYLRAVTVDGPLCMQHLCLEVEEVAIFVVLAL